MVHQSPSGHSNIDNIAPLSILEDLDMDNSSFELEGLAGSDEVSATVH